MFLEYYSCTNPLFYYLYTITNQKSITMFKTYKFILALMALLAFVLTIVVYTTNSVEIKFLITTLDLLILLSIVTEIKN